MALLEVKRGEPDCYLLAIDTDEHPGNFEREMAAFMTGYPDGWGVGEEEAEITKREEPALVKSLESLLGDAPGEREGMASADIFPNPRYGDDGEGNIAVLDDSNRDKFPYPVNYSVAIYFAVIPDKGLLKIMEDRALRFGRERGINIEGFRFLEQRTEYEELKVD